MYNLCAAVEDLSEISQRKGFEAIASAISYACGELAIAAKAVELISYLAAVR